MGLCLFDPGQRKCRIGEGQGEKERFLERFKKKKKKGERKEIFGKTKKKKNIYIYKLNNNKVLNLIKQYMNSKSIHIKNI